MVDYRQIPEEVGKRGLRRTIYSSWRFDQFPRSYDDVEPYITFFVKGYSNVEDVPKLGEDFLFSKLEERRLIIIILSLIINVRLSVTPSCERIEIKD